MSSLISLEVFVSCVCLAFLLPPTVPLTPSCSHLLRPVSPMSEFSNCVSLSCLSLVSLSSPLPLSDYPSVAFFSFGVHCLLGVVLFSFVLHCFSRLHVSSVSFSVYFAVLPAFNSWIPGKFVCFFVCLLTTVLLFYACQRLSLLWGPTKNQT